MRDPTSTSSPTGFKDICFYVIFREAENVIFHVVAYSTGTICKSLWCYKSLLPRTVFCILMTEFTLSTLKVTEVI